MQLGGVLIGALHACCLAETHVLCKEHLRLSCELNSLETPSVLRHEFSFFVAGLLRRPSMGGAGVQIEPMLGRRSTLTQQIRKFS